MSDKTLEKHPSGFILVNAKLRGQACDVLVENGRIKATGPSGSIEAGGVERFDAEGRILFPSFIDAHVHLREPGFEYKEDIKSGLAAAAHGGFGTVMAMANTKPVNDTPSVTGLMLEKAARHWPHGPRLCPVGALTVGLEGKEMAPLGELSKAGCIAFSNDGVPVADTEVFRRAVEYAAQWGKIVIDHCEDPFLARGSHMNEGAVSGSIGIKGQPTAAEAFQVARDILLSEYLGLPIHLAHISCAQSLNLIAEAKARGVKITAETCPHYLHLDERELEKYNTLAKVNPPLRTREDVEAVRRALASGVLDILATDHAPHAPHEKEEPLDAAPNGMVGLETALPLTYALVRQGLLTEERFVELWHHNPARIFGLPENNFDAGDPADFFLFDADDIWVVSRENLHSKSINTPFIGRAMHGKVFAHWISGHRIV